MEEQLSQCFESIGRGETFSQIETCKPFEGVYALKDGNLFSSLILGVATGVALTMILLVVLGLISEN
jgi:hypothetical protein